MKKLAFILSLAMTVAASYGQGYITANADASTLVQTNSQTDINGSPTGGGTVGNTPKGGGGYQFALLTQAFTGTTNSTSLIGSASLNGWLFTGLQVANSATFAGRYSFGTDVQAANAPVGVNNQWLVVGWSSNLGATWATFSAELQSGVFSSQSGFYGVSVVGVAAAGAAPPATPTSIIGAGNPIGVGFQLNTLPVPEPGTFAIAGLGSAAMLIFRRRRK